MELQFVVYLDGVPLALDTLETIFRNEFESLEKNFQLADAFYVLKIQKEEKLATCVVFVRFPSASHHVFTFSTPIILFDLMKI